MSWTVSAGDTLGERRVLERLRWDPGQLGEEPEHGRRNRPWESAGRARAAPAAPLSAAPRAGRTESPKCPSRPARDRPLRELRPEPLARPSRRVQSRGCRGRRHGDQCTQRFRPDRAGVPGKLPAMNAPVGQQEQPKAPAAVDTPSKARTLMLVVGSGRSGTSLFTGIMQRLGFHVPQPEVTADSTNPRGFAEPKWVVDFHTALLGRAGVQVADARPSAWAQTARVAMDDDVRRKLREWLAAEFAKSDNVRHQGPAALVVPAAVAPVRPGRGRHGEVRDRPAAPRGGDRQQAAVVRQLAGRRRAHGRLDQPGALHRARDPRGPAGVHQVPGHARRLDRRHRPRRRRARPRSDPRRAGGVHRADPRVRRPVAQPLALELGGVRDPRRSARCRRRGLDARSPASPTRTPTSRAPSSRSRRRGLHTSSSTRTPRRSPSPRSRRPGAFPPPVAPPSRRSARFPRATSARSRAAGA